MNSTKIHLLLVDDNPLDAALAQRMLQSLEKELPISTFWVNNAVQAMGEVQHGQYDLMLLDYQMPSASGLDVLTAIHKLPQSQQPAVIMLTASGSEKVAVEAMKLGARDYLRKDELEVAPLMRALLSALSQKRMQDQLNRYLVQTEADLRMARQLQHALLPQHFPGFPRTAVTDNSALRFHARYVSTTELGGDFYDVLPLSDTQAGVFICDVMGHGVRAALVAAKLRALVQETQPLAQDPGQFLAEINRGLMKILRHTDEPLFATAFYLVADIGRGQLRYANAGHPFPLHLKRDAQVVEPLQFPPDSSGPAMGLFDVPSYQTATCQMSPHDLVMLFTDGLFEVQDGNDDEYGQERLLAGIRKRISLPPTQMFDELLNESRQFSASEQFCDDVCLVGVEIARTTA